MELVIRLFKKDFIKFFISNFFLFILVMFFYNRILENFNKLDNSVSRTYHIVIENNISSLFLIKSYLKGYNLFKEKELNLEIRRGAYIFKSKVKLIGIKNHFPFGFKFEYIDSREYEWMLRLTTVEILDKLENDGMLFNRALYNSLSLLGNPSVDTYTIKNNKNKIRLTSYGIYDDMSNELIIYTSLKNFERLANGKNIKIAVLLKNIKYMNKVLSILKTHSIVAYPYFYKEKSKKEFVSRLKYYLFLSTIVTFIFIAIITFLLFFRDIVLKQKEIVTLNFIGYDIRYSLFLLINLIFIFDILLVQILLGFQNFSFYLILFFSAFSFIFINRIYEI